MAITAPACPLFVKINLVEDTFKDSLNRVVIKRSEGNTENSNASLTYIVVSNITMANAILIINIKSKKKGGNGTIIISITAIINIEIEFLNILLISYIPFSLSL